MGRVPACRGPGTAAPSNMISKSKTTHHHQVDLQEVMETLPETVQAAGVVPTFQLLKLCAIAHEECLIGALRTFSAAALVSENYFLTSLEDMTELAQMLKHIPLDLDERLIFCTSPVAVTDTGTAHAIVCFFFFGTLNFVSPDWFCMIRLYFLIDLTTFCILFYNCRNIMLYCTYKQTSVDISFICFCFDGYLRTSPLLPDNPAP